MCINIYVWNYININHNQISKIMKTPLKSQTAKQLL